MWRQQDQKVVSYYDSKFQLTVSFKSLHVNVQKLHRMQQMDFRNNLIEADERVVNALMQMKQLHFLVRCACGSMASKSFLHHRAYDVLHKRRG